MPNPDPLPSVATPQTPWSLEEHYVLEQRAEALARPRATADRIEASIRFLRCRLGMEEVYGIPYPFLEELLYPNSLVRVPGVPAFIAGVIARRSEMLTVVDPTFFFRVTPTERTAETRVVIVRSGGGACRPAGACDRGR
ncbi:MAG: purine-binding chemotaxis protein CheW [Rhodospirillaceae bacterium]|nr:MAG: purine-binding chemotaxis protein CheW [Rhodospirillaceae bacterium]